MTNPTVLRFSLIGFALLAASKIISSISALTEPNFTNTGRCLDDNPGSGIAWTCTAAAAGALNCDMSAAGNGTLTICTDCGSICTTLNATGKFCSNGTECD